MKLHHYKEKYHKKTDINFNTLIECNLYLIKLLKTWKGTPAEIDIIERKINQVKINMEQLEVVDPALERVINPEVTIKMNGFQNLKIGGV